MEENNSVSEKDLSITSSEELKSKVSDVEVFGDPDCWKCICKASSKSQGWMKSTKAMDVEGLGCVVQVTTQQGDQVSEAVCFIPGASICSKPNGNKFLSIKPTVGKR